MPNERQRTGTDGLHDSPPEETVWSELVSLERQIPCLAANLQGILSKMGLAPARWPKKSEVCQSVTGEFPTHPNREFI
jgi:hypothetical protein